MLNYKPFFHYFNIFFFSKPKLQSLLSFECVYSIRVNSASVAVEGFVWKIQQWINVPAASVLCQLLQASLIAELQHFVWMFRCLHNNNSLNPATASPPNLSVFLLHHLSILPNIDYPSHPYVFCRVCIINWISCAQCWRYSVCIQTSFCLLVCKALLVSFRSGSEGRAERVCQRARRWEVDSALCVQHVRICMYLFVKWASRFVCEAAFMILYSHFDALMWIRNKRINAKAAETCREHRAQNDKVTAQRLQSRPNLQLVLFPSVFYITLCIFPNRECGRWVDL